MIRWCSIVLLLVKKEWQLEWRSKELVTLLACNATLLAVLVGAGVSSAVLDASTTQKVFPMLLWVIFMLSATTSVTRFNEQELEGRGFEGLLLGGVTGAQMYLAKTVVMGVFFVVSFVLLSFLLALCLDQPVFRVVSSLFLVGVGSSTALASLLVILAAVASTSKLKGVLLPIISLPVLFPVFLCGMEMTTEVVVQGGLQEGTPWPVILLCAQTLYVAVGINLFEVAIKE